MKIKLLAFYLLALPLLAMETKAEKSLTSKEKWTIVSELKPADRKTFFISNIQKKFGGLPMSKYEELYFMSNKRMGNYGFSFTYLGDVEKEFLAYLSEIDNAQTKAVFPACGYGRTVIDALAKTNHIEILANDFDREAMKILAESVEHYLGSKSSRINYNNGDMIALLRSLGDNSVDVIFSANVIHFLTPVELNTFILEGSRVLKQGGRLFLTWEGYLPVEYGQLIMKDQIHAEPILRRNYTAKNRMKSPGFLGKDFFNSIGYTDKHHNYLSKEEISRVGTKYYLHEHSGRHYEISGFTCSAPGRDPLKVSYQEIPLPENPRAFPIFMVILEKSSTPDID